MPLFRIKAMINKHKTKVLFVEADRQLVDFLFHFLRLPLGKIAKVLEDPEAPAVASLCNLRKSVAKLDRTFFVNEGAKIMLLNPINSFEDTGPVFETSSNSFKYYTCGNRECWSETLAKNIVMYHGSGNCHSCGRLLYREINIEDFQERRMVGFTNYTGSFFISDDLRMEPCDTGFIQTLRNFDITDMDTDGAELKSFTYDIVEIFGLLKWCFLSETPLTDFLISKNKTHKPPFVANQDNLYLPLKTEETGEKNSKEMVLKIIIQKSKKKLLFAQAEADFVEALFSFLTIPFGGIEYLLKGNTCYKNLDNIYKSLAAMDGKYFQSQDVKNMLMNPKLAPGYSSRKQFLPLSEDSPPILHVYERKLRYENIGYPVVSFRYPKGLDNYVKEGTSYLVTDDLTVMPFELTSGLSILDGLKIPLSDVDELKVHIGLKEVLGILEASLISTCVLSTVLTRLIPMKLPKLEQ